MTELLYGDMSEGVIGAALDVHNVLGCGFLESVYEEAMAHEMDIRGIGYERQKPLIISYKGKHIKEYICDFLIVRKASR